jgi:hypothetical protein
MLVKKKTQKKYIETTWPWSLDDGNSLPETTSGVQTVGV